MKSNLLFLFVLLVSCKPGSNQFKDPSPHSVSFVSIEPGVKIEVLDWGGTGEPILFLAGLGNTAHVFDEFALKFTDKYHALGMTRRGFGASTISASGYDNNTRAHDILLLIDKLKINKITLIGHSIAGDELNKFAILYPNRVNKLIYLDAAYNRTDMSMFANAPPFPSMTLEDSLSVENSMKYIFKVTGMPVIEAEYRQGSILDKNGRYLREVTPDSVITAIVKDPEIPDYASIHAPALSFYAVPDSIDDIFTFYNLLDSAGRKSAMDIFPLIQADSQKQMEVFKKEMINGQVVEVHGANHYLFVSNATEVAEKINKFLLE